MESDFTGHASHNFPWAPFAVAPFGAPLVHHGGAPQGLIRPFTFPERQIKVCVGLLGTWGAGRVMVGTAALRGGCVAIFDRAGKKAKVIFDEYRFWCI